MCRPTGAHHCLGRLKKTGCCVVFTFQDPPAETAIISAFRAACISYVMRRSAGDNRGSPVGTKCRDLSRLRLQPFPPSVARDTWGGRGAQGAFDIRVNPAPYRFVGSHSPTGLTNFRHSGWFWHDAEVARPDEFELLRSCTLQRSNDCG
jgi:hypothetical protein